MPINSVIQYFSRFRKNLLVRVSSFNALSVLVTALSGLISSKVVAILLGAEGMALIGNLRNFLSTITSVGTLGLYNGFVRYVAEHQKNKEELRDLFSTSYFLCFVVTMSLAAWLYYDSVFWNHVLFGEKYDYHYVFEAAGIALPFYCINVMCLGIINGFSKYKVYIILNIVSSILGLSITILLIWQYQLQGAFYALTINPAISFLITFVIILNQKNFAKLLWANRITLSYIKKMSSYAIMALVSATLLPTILIKIRNFIILNEGVDQAGYWEAMRRISDQYMVFVTTLITLYLLPKLSQIKDNKSFRTEVLNFYKVILPVFGMGFLVIYLLRNVIIQLLFAKSFASMEPLFFWQLIGDVFRILSIALACQFLAKRMFWSYIVTEVISFSVLYLSSIYLIRLHGFVGASMAHFFSYIIYFLMVIFVFRNQLFRFSNKPKVS